jgi:hypothetical protein
VTEFWRVTDHKIDRKTYVNIRDGYRLAQDFAKVGGWWVVAVTPQVSCMGGDAKTYTNVLITIVPNDERVKQLLNVNKPPRRSGLNVFMIGLDSMSHMHVKRKLPKSYDYFTRVLKVCVH